MWQSLIGLLFVTDPEIDETRADTLQKTIVFAQGTLRNVYSDLKQDQAKRIQYEAKECREVPSSYSKPERALLVPQEIPGVVEMYRVKPRFLGRLQGRDQKLIIWHMKVAIISNTASGLSIRRKFLWNQYKLQSRIHATCLQISPYRGL